MNAISRKLFLFALSLLILPLLAAAQNADSDNFLGTWNKQLNAKDNTTKFETLKIEKTANGYQINFDWHSKDGKDATHLTTTTQMKGEFVRPVDGRGKKSSRRQITRVDQNTFVEKTGALEDHYQVSPDGKTMTMNRTYLKKGQPTTVTLTWTYDRAS